jgi:prepilin-type processing-associated H-X9-DG protein
MPCGVIAAVVAAIAVVIIPILAAILFPVFARARGKAQQASCLSNLKQLGLATVMYAADYNDIFPDASTWRDATLPYTKAPTIYECPTSGLGQQSYEMATPLSRVNQTWITNRPDCALLYDAGLPQGSGPHNGGGDVCYADAHVKWIVGSAFAGLPPPAISPPQAP